MQVDLLAAEIATQTPEVKHFARGTTFEWVYFKGIEDGPFPELGEAIATQLAKRYQVFRDMEQIPSEFRPEAEGSNFRHGFLFSVRILREGTNRVVVTYSDLEGPLAGSVQQISYRWTGTKWVRVRVGDLIVA